MQVGNQIKKYRDQLHLSQEQLAEKIYVTRQTISNWETNKSYPDIHSLVLLSQIFNVSIDQLVKGDLEMMKYYLSLFYHLSHYGLIYKLQVSLFGY